MTIPFFVVDRPMSLKILKYCELDKQKGIFGLMGHANTTKNFQKSFKDFEAKNIIKAVDSGVFTREGCNLDYYKLFAIYDNMKAEYGVMIDFIKEKKKTIDSAKTAMKIYKKKKHPFKLVGVAQGKNLDEYVKCYEQLKEIGFQHIAIGGLLKKNVNSARWVKVKDEELLKKVLQQIRSTYKDDWLFLLGCYSPRRHFLFDEYKIYGGDYKGWIFNYKTPRMWIQELTKELESIKDHKIIKTKKLVIEKFKNMNDVQKREYRFKQVKMYFENKVFSLFKNRLLIISCSQRKTNISNPAPAIEVYDGPIYRTLRKMKKHQQFPNNLHTIIISAKYGVLGLYDLIDLYDLKMTESRANEMKDEITTNIQQFLNNKQFEEGFISLGKTYLSTLDNYPFKFPIEQSEGKIGEKLSQTKE